MDNHKLSFSEVKSQLAKQKLTNLSFGGSVMFITLLPIINFLVMPAAVIGATIFWLEQYSHLPSSGIVKI